MGVASDVVDAEFREAGEQLAVREEAAAGSITQRPVRPPFDADRELHQHREVERFKSGATTEADWHTLDDGKKVIKADSAHKLYPYFGVSFQILSRDEFGDLGTRRVVIERPVYPMKTVRRRGKSGWYDKDVPDTDAEPRMVKDVLYTVTIRGSNRFGQEVDLDSSYQLSEDPTAPDNSLRKKAQTRARKTIGLILVGGVDYLRGKQDRDAEQHFGTTVTEEARAASPEAQRVPAQRLADLAAERAIVSLREWLIEEGFLETGARSLSAVASVEAEKRLLEILPIEEPPAEPEPGDGTNEQYEARRRRYLFSLHRELNQDTDERRALYAKLCDGKTSSLVLTYPKEVEAVIAHLEELRRATDTV